MPLPSPIRCSLALALCFIGVTDLAWARGYRVDQVPGGLEFDCAVCHDLRQFTRLTVFGLQVRDHLIYPNGPPEDPNDIPLGEEGDVDWAALAPLDADGDGYTNGEELGDPEGLFRMDDPQPDFPFTRPDLADDFPCGSGTVEGPEACDGEAFAGARCTDFGFPGGALTCRDDCTIDTAGCNQCGDGVLDPDEVCDGALPDDVVCPDGTEGAPRCTACAIDFSGCRAPEPDAGPARDAEPDAGLDMAWDAEPDAEPDGVWDAEPARDAAWDAAPDGPALRPDARPDIPSDAAADRALDGPVLDGPVLDGPVLDGPELDGPMLDGPSLDDAPPAPLDDDGGCHVARPGPPPLMLALLAAVAVLRRRRAR